MGKAWTPQEWEAALKEAEEKAGGAQRVKEEGEGNGAPGGEASAAAKPKAEPGASTAGHGPEAGAHDSKARAMELDPAAASSEEGGAAGGAAAPAAANGSTAGAAAGAAGASTGAAGASAGAGGPQKLGLKAVPWRERLRQSRESEATRVAFGKSGGFGLTGSQLRVCRACQRQPTNMTPGPTKRPHKDAYHP